MKGGGSGRQTIDLPLRPENVKMCPIKGLPLLPAPERH